VAEDRVTGNGASGPVDGPAGTKGRARAGAAGGPAGPAGPAHVRGRLLAAALAVLLVIGVGVALDRGVGARAAPGGAATGITGSSGAAFCPHGGGEGWTGWVDVANPGRRPVRVRLTTFGPHGVLARSSFVLPPLSGAEREVPATDPGAATEVEYFGGWAAASAVVRSDGSPPSVAAERCAGAPSGRWYLPDTGTGSGQTAYLVVMNPFPQDAAFDVLLQTDRRSPVRPGPLTPYVLPAGTSVALKVNDFLVQGPDEALVTAQVRIRIGRVVAGSLGLSSAGVREEAGIAAPATRWLLPGAGSTGTSTLQLRDATGRRADVSVILQGESTQSVASIAGDSSIGPGMVRQEELDAGSGPFGVEVRSTNRVPIVVARRLTGEHGDVASVDGVAGTARRWLVLPTSPPSGSSRFLILMNPQQDPATLTVRLLGGRGEVPAGSLASITVPGGRQVVHEVPTDGPAPVAVLVTAASGTVVAAEASLSGVGGGYASTPGAVVPRGA
jgi:Family of unknown function (DUF5719)